jgi:hypothetical protein
MQRVGLAPEIEQLATRGFHALGLAHDDIAEGEHLIPADDIGLGRNVADGFGFGARQDLSHVMRRECVLATNRLAHGALVKPWGFDDKGEACGFQQLGSRLARRSEDERRTPRL